MRVFDNEEESYDIVAALKKHGDTLGQSGKPASRELLLDAADTIESYQAMKDGFTVRATELEDTVSNLSTLVQRLSFVVHHKAPEARKIADQALDYLKRKGLIESIVRESAP